MSDQWKEASRASQRFGDQARDYDRHRPRYPEGVFDDIVTIAGVRPGTKAIEIGAGTGIATEPLVDRGLALTAIEPAAEMAAVAEAKLAGRASIFVGRFEDYRTQSPVQLVAAFNAWHWMEPTLAVDRVAEAIVPNGFLALIWTEVVSWGQEPFEDRLSEVFGHVWPKRLDLVDGSLQPIRNDPRFGEIQVRHHRFERSLDAEAFVAVTKTYGGQRTAGQYDAIAKVIEDDFGVIKKVEDAALYISRRC
jgi:SAM-dependent methyltransferase